MPLYHFTDSRNVASIREYGLLSWKRLLQRNIEHWPASNTLSRELDDRRKLGDYIRLCKAPEHPMAYRAVQEQRIRDFVWLEISDSVVRWQATKFSDDNATSNQVVIDHDPKTALDSHSVQAEVLVLGSLNVKWIGFFKTPQRKVVPLLNYDERYHYNIPL